MFIDGITITTFILGIPAYFIFMIIDNRLKEKGFYVLERTAVFVIYYIVCVSLLCHYEFNFIEWFK